VHEAIADTARRTVRLDVVFANAGITAGPGFATDGVRDPAGAFDRVPDALWQKVLDTT
jgi:NAD(P)-dependent dehydrogenase (short-subunit alcohol dehydrogenase family)